MYGVIGGSGLSRLDTLASPRQLAVATPYGEPSGPLTCGLMRSVAVVFLPRHGYGHTIAAHRINYRANIWALKDAGVREIVSVASVGGIRPDLTPGRLVVPHQIVDYTWGRESSFFEGDACVTHIDFTNPFSPLLRAKIMAAARSCGSAVIDGAVYATTQGPRLETAAEIDRIERDGGEIVGMTGMPEAALARELGLEYATLAVVANHAAGRGDSREGIHVQDIEKAMGLAKGTVTLILEALVTS